MRTKKGDWVRICFDSVPGADSDIYGTRLSYDAYQVAKVVSPKLIRVIGLPCEVKSWVLCADMKEGA